HTAISTLLPYTTLFRSNIITHKITIQTGAEINSCIRTADPAAIQKEKEGLHLIATPKLEKKFPPTPTEQKRREDPNPELVWRAVPEVKKARIEEIVPPVSTNFRSW